MNFFWVTIPHNGDILRTGYLPEIQELLEAQTWTFAKTMPHNPHYWSVKKDWEDPADFHFAFHYIVAHGEDKIFGRYSYKVLFLNGWRYWTMTEDYEHKWAGIINRAEGELP